jgi:hypothetical protein
MGLTQAAAELLGVTESHLPEHRERLYPSTATLSMFMRQALDAGRSVRGISRRTDGTRGVGRWPNPGRHALNQRKVRKGALGQLYAQRWNVELDRCASGRSER